MLGCAGSGVVYLTHIRANLNYHQNRSIVFSLFYSLIVCSLPLFGISKYVPGGLLTTCCFEFIRQEWIYRLFYIYLVTLGFIIPVSCITTCYLLMIFRQTNEIRQNRFGPSQLNLNKIKLSLITARDVNSSRDSNWQEIHNFSTTPKICSYVNDARARR